MGHIRHGATLASPRQMSHQPALEGIIESTGCSGTCPLGRALLTTSLIGFEMVVSFFVGCLPFLMRFKLFAPCELSHVGAPSHARSKPTALVSADSPHTLQYTNKDLPEWTVSIKEWPRSRRTN